MYKRRQQYINYIGISHRKTETSIDKLLSFMRFRPIVIVVFLVASFLYNFGYFLETDYHYLSFLTYADFLYGTIPFIVLYSLILFFLSFLIPLILTPSICEDLFLYVSKMNTENFWHNFIYKEIRLKSIIGRAIQNIITGFFVDDEYISYPIKQYEQKMELKKNRAKQNIGKNSKYKRFLAQIRLKLKRPYKKVSKCTVYFANILISILLGASIFILVFSWIIIYFVIKYHLSLLSNSTIVDIFNDKWSMLYVISCFALVYYINTDRLKISAFVCSVLLFYAPLIGEEIFWIDFYNSRSTVVTQDKEEYQLVRAISNGYLSKKDNKLFFIPQDQVDKITANSNNVSLKNKA